MEKLLTEDFSTVFLFLPVYEPRALGAKMRDDPRSREHRETVAISNY